MKKKNYPLLLLLILFASCQINKRTIRESNYQLWLNKSDFTYTEPRTGQASQTKIFGIDWNRLFNRTYEYGSFGAIPGDIGPRTNASLNVGGASLGEGSTGYLNSILASTVGLSSASRAEEFAINDLIVKNPNYDLILFPQFEVRKKWFLIGSKTQVFVKARLARITPENQ